MSKFSNERLGDNLLWLCTVLLFFLLALVAVFGIYYGIILLVEMTFALTLTTTQKVSGAFLMMVVMAIVNIRKSANNTNKK